MRTKKEVTPSDLDNIMDNSNSSYIIADFDVEEDSFKQMFIYKNGPRIELFYNAGIDEGTVMLAKFVNDDAAEQFVKLLVNMTKFDSSH